MEQNNKLIPTGNLVNKDTSYTISTTKPKFSKLTPDQKTKLYLSIVFFLLIMAIDASFVFLFSPENNSTTLLYKNSILISFLIIAIITIVYNFILKPNSNKEKCTEKIQGKIIDIYVSKQYDEENGYDINNFSPIYEYTYKNTTYQIESHYTTTNDMEINTIEDIYINPDSPTMLYTKKEGSYKLHIAIPISLTIMVIYIGYLIFLIANSFKL